MSSKQPKVETVRDNSGSGDEDLNESYRVLNFTQSGTADSSRRDIPSVPLETTEDLPGDIAVTHDSVSTLGPSTHHFRDPFDVSSTSIGEVSMAEEEEDGEGDESKTSDQEIQEYFHKMFADEGASSSDSTSDLGDDETTPVTPSGRKKKTNPKHQYRKSTSNHGTPVQSPQRNSKSKSKSEQLSSPSPPKTAAVAAKSTKRKSKQADQQQQQQRISQLKSENRDLKENLMDLTTRIKSEIKDDTTKDRQRQRRRQKEQDEEKKLEEEDSAADRDVTPQKQNNNNGRSSSTGGRRKSVEKQRPDIGGGGDGDLTAEEWEQAQEQIRFLETEIDKVTALCAQLVESPEEEKEEEEKAPPRPGDWRRAQKQIDYLERELENVSDLCSLLTKSADDSIDAIEKLEREKQILEILNKKLEEALKAAQKKNSGNSGQVEENKGEDRMCWACCCWWIPEPLVWFVSYVLRVD